MRIRMDSPKMPEELRSRADEIAALTDAFCDQYLDADYRGLCRKMAEWLCRVRAPIQTGQAMGWAAGVVYTIGWVNFLTDPTQSPHLRAADIANGFSVSQATMMARSKVIREALGVHALDIRWCTRRMAAQNPLTWMVKVDGFIMDARRAPREIQEEAYRRGLIPFIPEPNEAKAEPALEVKPRPPRPKPPRQKGPGLFDNLSEADKDKEPTA